MNTALKSDAFQKAHQDFVFSADDASLTAIRENGVANFNRLGLPTRKHEAWRYTNLKSLEQAVFQNVPAAGSVLSSQALEDLDAYKLSLVDGVLVTSDVELPEGIRIESLEAGHALAEGVLGKLAYDDDAMAALNSAFLNTGIVIRVARNCVVDKPVHLKWVVSAQERDTALHPRVVVVLEENSELNLVESFLGASGEAYLNNTVSEISLERGARLEHTRLQEEGMSAYHLAQLYVEQKRDSTYRSHLFNFGASIGRTGINVRLLEPGSFCYLGGLYMIGGKQHADVYTKIEHVAPHCQSQEVYKGILAGSATSVFNGYVLVQKEAQKTDSSQQNRNLILSKKATANTRPQLEIYADDVKCAHGATVGQLDNDQIFYMRARGISLDQARSELTYGFAMDVLAEMKFDGALDYLEKAIRSWLLSDEVSGSI